ncbi:uncharacterized protein LOC127158336, partial [Labeo rohita]
MSASVMATAILSIWAASYAPENLTTTPEVLPVVKSVPEVSSDLPEPCHVMSPSVLAIAILSVWAAHSAPEVSSVRQPTPELPSDLKFASEALSDHETDPEASPVGEAAPMPPEVSASAVDPPREAAFYLKLSASPLILSASSVSTVPRSQAITRFPAPEVPSGPKSAPEVPSGPKSAPEVPSDLKSAPEAFPVGEAAPMPPEVPASAVEPLMEGAFTSILSASPLLLSASSVPVLPRSQSMTEPPVPPGELRHLL